MCQHLFFFHNINLEPLILITHLAGCLAFAFGVGFLHFHHLFAAFHKTFALVRLVVTLAARASTHIYICILLVAFLHRLCEKRLSE